MPTATTKPSVKAKSLSGAKSARITPTKTVEAIKTAVPATVTKTKAAVVYPPKPKPGEKDFNYVQEFNRLNEQVPGLILKNRRLTKHVTDCSNKIALMKHAKDIIFTPSEAEVIWGCTEKHATHELREKLLALMLRK